MCTPQLDGDHAVQVVRDGAEDLQQEDLQRDDGVHPAHEDDAGMQERDQAKLRHQVGN